MIISPADYDTATRTLIGEADDQPLSGQQRVVFVMRNRAQWGELEDHHPEFEWWGTAIGLVCLHPWQFSCQNPGPLHDRLWAIDAHSAHYLSRLQIVEDVLEGRADEKLARDPDGNLLTHYKRIGTRASWDTAVERKNLTPVVIASHIFFALGPTG